MKERNISITKKARYYTHGNDIGNCERIWFALHGYGQLGKYFIRHFEVLDPETDFVIVPEGLHRFYLEGNSGRVGASWMTKEARLDDIDDYVGYLDMLYAMEVKAETDAKIIGFGFSQGVATLARWMAMGSAKFDTAVFWAGSFPPDLEPLRAKQTFGEMDVHAFAGSEDTFIDQEQLNRVKSHLEQLDIHPHWHHFNGGHAIVKDVLKDFASSLESK